MQRVHWQRWFLVAQLGIGWDSSSLPQSPAEHVLVAAVQMRPLPTTHSSLPHIQVDGLALEPSVMAQTGPLRHLFWDI